MTECYVCHKTELGYAILAENVPGNYCPECKQYRTGNPLADFLYNELVESQRKLRRITDNLQSQIRDLEAQVNGLTKRYEKHTHQVAKKTISPYPVIEITRTNQPD